MNLETIIFEKESLNVFINKYCIAESLTKSQKHINEHPILFLKHNWALNKNKINCLSIFDLKVDDVYIYENSKSQHCIYLIMDLNHNQFDIFFKNFGDSLNVTYKEYLDHDFEFINWNYNSFEIFLNKLHLTVDSRNTYIIQIMNMPYNEIMDYNIIEF